MSSRLLFLVITLQSILSIHSDRHHQCAHDKVDHKHYRNKKKIPTFTNNDNSINKRKTLSQYTISNDMNKIRIYTDSSHLENDWSDDQDLISYYIQDVIPAAVDFLSNILYVRAIDGLLTFERQCNEWDDNNSSICIALNDNNNGTRCGELIDIPDNAFDSLIYCPVNYTTLDDCVIFDQGTGYTNTDIVLYVSGTDHTLCNDFFGFSSFCHTNYYDRPIAGYLNLCRDVVTSQEYFTWEEEVNIIVHEILHVLGFSSKGFAYYRYNDTQRSVRSPRDSNGDPFYTTDDDGIIRYQYGDNTAKTVTIRDKETIMIVLPTGVEIVKDFFECDDMIGIELEDSGNTNAVISSHLESRIFVWPLMGQWVAPSASLTVFTLAILADSGWYNINWNYTYIPPYGRGLGCDFINNKCIDPSSDYNVDDKLYCINNVSYSCGRDYTSKRNCAIETYNTSLPEYGQYYEQDNIGGAFVGGDYCPSYIPYHNGDCRDIDAGNAQEALGGIICNECKCNMMISIDESEYSTRGLCRKHRCFVDAFNTEYIGIRIGFYGSDNYDIQEWITCWNEQDDGQLKDVIEYSSAYQMECPIVSDICYDYNPWLCNGHGSFNHFTQKCVCSQGYIGDNCNIMNTYINRNNNGNNGNNINISSWNYDSNDKYVGYVELQIYGFDTIIYNEIFIRNAVKLLIAIPTNTDIITQINLEFFDLDDDSGVLDSTVYYYDEINEFSTNDVENGIIEIFPDLFGNNLELTIVNIKYNSSAIIITSLFNVIIVWMLTVFILS